MHEERPSRGWHRGEPAANLSAIRVARESVDLSNPSPHRHIAAMDSQGVRPVQQRAAAGSLGLKTRHEHSRVFIGQPAGEMVEDAAAVHHSARGDHDSRAAMGVDRLRLVGSSGCPYEWTGQGFSHAGQFGLAEIMLSLMAAKDRHRFHGHR